MYTYYGLAALGPQFQKYLFWKRYITTIQLTQFVLVFLHCIKTFLDGCEKQSIFLYINVFHALVFFYLFSTFYRQSYNKKMNSLKDNKTDKLVKNDQLINDKSTSNGLRLRTIKDENSNNVVY